MHILEIRIKGFRSYKDECVLKFDRGLNIIIGKNGSGKSNIVNAIGFVFGEYSTAARHDVQNASNESNATEVTVFLDNSDNKFLQGKQQKVTLYRSLFRGKYSYKFNSKSVTKKEYRQILSSAGLHEQLNFYIVKQGMISELSIETPSQRLYTLKDIAGHKTFEAKTLEAKQVLQECKTKRASIAGYLEHLENGIKIVQNEHKRISEWQEIENRRLILQNQMKVFQMNEIKSELEALTDKRRDKSDVVSQLGRKLTSIKETSDDFKDKINILETCISAKNKMLKQLENDLFNLVDDLGAVEKEETELKIDENIRNSKLVELEEELSSLGARIESVKSEYHEAKEAAEAAERDLNEAIREADRNNYSCDKTNVAAKIEEMIKLALEEKKSQFETCNHLKSEIEESKNKIVKLQAELDNFQPKSDIDQKLNDHLKEMAKITEQKRELQLQVTQTKNDLAQLRIEYHALSKSYGKAISYSNKSCVDIVNTWVERCKIPQNEFLGFIVDIFNCDPEFYRCIEQVVGHRLFNVVVSSLSVAQSLLSYVKNDQSENKTNGISFQGRLVIIIADMLPQPNDYHNIPSECVRIVECIEYNESLYRVISHVFGNSLLIPDIKLARPLTGEGFDCVTLEGEAFFEGGRIRIGSYTCDSSIALHKRMRDMGEKFKVLELKSSENELQISELDKILRVMDNERVSMSEERKKQDLANEKKLGEIMSLKSLVQGMEQRLAQILAAGERLDFQIDEWNKQISCLNTLDNTNVKRVDLDEFSRRKQLCDEQLEYITKKLYQLKSRHRKISDEILITKHKSKAVMRSDEIKRLISALRNRIQNEENKIMAAKKKIFDVKGDFNRHHLSEMDVRREWTEEFTNMSQIDQKISVLKSKIEKLRIDESMLSANRKLGKLSKDQLIGLLKETNDLLKEKSLVNSTKMMAHYSSLLTQYASLQSGYNSLIASNEAIEEVLEKLDKLKTEHFIQYLKKVNEKLHDIFKILVPEGSARLINDNNGLDVQISFGGGVFEPIRRLSGGQKSLVSLSLILALQQMESCPFLIMDEIDAALDDEYRNRVSYLIGKLVNKGYQVICTTHRPQLLTFSNKIFHVENKGDGSRIRVVDRDEANYLIGYEIIDD